jgi:hypothetical protein
MSNARSPRFFEWGAFSRAKAIDPLEIVLLVQGERTTKRTVRDGASTGARSSCMSERDREGRPAVRLTAGRSRRVSAQHGPHQLLCPSGGLLSEDPAQERLGPTSGKLETLEGQQRVPFLGRIYAGLLRRRGLQL